MERGESDRDWFRFTSPGGGPQILRAEVTPVPNMDIVLELVAQGESQPMFKADEAGIGGGEAIAGLQVSGSSFYLLVRELWVDGLAPTENVSDSYDIRYTLSAPSPAIEAEPNDDLERAHRVEPGRGVRGYVGGRRDLDDYCLARGPSGTASVRVTGVEGVDLVTTISRRFLGTSTDPSTGDARAATGGPLVALPVTNAYSNGPAMPRASARGAPCRSRSVPARRSRWVDSAASVVQGTIVSNASRRVTWR